MLLVVVLGVVAGTVLPVQMAVNARLARTLGTTLRGSMVSFAVGTGVLGALVVATGTRLPLSDALHGPWWLWLGGVCGVVFLTVNMVLMPRIGASATVVAAVVGQMVGGLLSDALGAFGTTVRPLTTARVVGAGFVVLGAILVNWIRSPRAGVSLWLAAGGVLGGLFSAVQTTVNGRLAGSFGSPLAAALVSFLIGTVILVVLLGALPRALPTTPSPGPAPWWAWSGGLLGAAFVLVNAFAAPLLGTSVTVAVVLLGQVGCGLLVDRLGVLGASRRPLTAARLAGAVLVLLGVAVVRLVG